MCAHGLRASVVDAGRGRIPAKRPFRPPQRMVVLPSRRAFTRCAKISLDQTSRKNHERRPKARARRARFVLTSTRSFDANAVHGPHCYMGTAPRCTRARDPRSLAIRLGDPEACSAFERLPGCALRPLRHDWHLLPQAPSSTGLELAGRGVRARPIAASAFASRMG